MRTDVAQALLPAVSALLPRRFSGRHQDRLPRVFEAAASRRISTRFGLLAIGALWLTSCVKPKPLEIMSEIPEFQLTSETGQPFDSKSLTGHIWVADFIYTTCDGPCPMMSHQMYELQTLTAEMPDVKLVSFTVDPAHDTPEVLAAYAKHFKPDSARWCFLTGEQAKLNTIALNGFKLNAVDGSMTHSTRFALVDQKRRIRAYYISSDEGMLKQMLHDIRQLERYPS